MSRSLARVDDWFIREASGDEADWNLDGGPLEEKRVPGFEDTPTFRKSRGDGWDVVFGELAVFCDHEGFRPCLAEMRWVENHEVERVSSKRHVGEVRDGIGRDSHSAAVADGCFTSADVHGENARVVFDVVHQPWTAAGIED